MYVYRPEMLRIRFGAVNSFLVKNRDGKYLMIDAGYPGMINTFKKKIAEAGILPKDIQLILITHAHHDHFGCLSDIKELCECNVAVHEYEAHLLQTGTIKTPPGTNLATKLISKIGQSFTDGQHKLEAVDPEIKITGELSLDSLGIDGKIITTPGHTEGSVSVIMDDGKAFVGDLAMNVFPWTGPIYPVFGHNRQQILKSWKKLIDLNVDLVYPGHGRAFGIRHLIRKYEMITGKAV
ncbi:MAG: MBL fold metallo-hydrolase [Bacteroidales bacterium]|nr:MBL fold metallo-hydrolase [Bacteroidales bacterium]